METGFLIATICLALFGVLATYDGIYLHIFRYRLYAHSESKFEHLTHTIRAILFPGILYYLYLGAGTTDFYIGLALVGIDILILGIDAYTETDSRAFMGGLPRWEYIVHLFVNGFHFAGIAVFLVLKMHITHETIALENNFTTVEGYQYFEWITKNLIPGGIILGLLHVLLIFKPAIRVWDKIRYKVSCC